MRKLLILLFLVTTVCASAQTVDAFGEHRYAAFLLSETDQNSIVFVGNSITNMHEWSEALQNHDVKGRGVSSTNAWRQLTYIENYLVGRPKKMFIMLGTNDMSTVYNFTLEQFIANMRCIISRAQHECPGIQIYIQSILPAQDSYGRSRSKGQTWNEALKELSAQYGVTYIDLTTALGGMCQSADQTLTRDGLHPTVRGYNIWLKEIMQYLPECTRQYPDDITNVYSTELGQAAANMHTEQFNQLDINTGDILFIGDEVVNAGEWHDIFHSFKVKNRGNGWNWPWYAVSGMKTTTYKLINAEKAAKASRIFMHAGVYEASKDRMTAANFLAQMQDWVARLKNNGYTASTAKPIYIVGTAPCSDATGNKLIRQYHESLRAWCESVEGLYYVDAFDNTIDAAGNVTVEGMVVGNASTGYFLYEEGYRRMAAALEAYVKEVDENAYVLTAAQLSERKARINARTALGDAISQLEKKLWSSLYDVTDPDALNQAISDAYAMLAANTATNDELLAQIPVLESAALNAGLAAALPKVSTDDDTYWHTLQDVRGKKYVCSNGVGTGITGVDMSDAVAMKTQWKFNARENGTLDIINRADGTVIPSGTVATGSQIASAYNNSGGGWEFLPSASEGYYIIVSGDNQFNMSNSGTVRNLLNWGNGTNTTDTGCQYAIVEVEHETHITDGISRTSTVGTTRCYDLQGRCLTRPRRGIYIRNGNKVIY